MNRGRVCIFFFFFLFRLVVQRGCRTEGPPARLKGRAGQGKRPGGTKRELLRMYIMSQGPVL